MKKRLEFKCWKCQKTYELLREIGEGNPQLLVACPFCHAEGIVDLDPYREPIDTIYKGGSPQKAIAEEMAYNLPAILPTKPKP